MWLTILFLLQVARTSSQSNVYDREYSRECSDPYLSARLESGISTSVANRGVVEKLAAAKLDGPTDYRHLETDLRGLTPSMVAFLSEHGACLGVSAEQLRFKRVSDAPLGGALYYHFDQLHGGFKVHGGDVMFIMSSLGDVMHARANPLPRADVMVKYFGADTIGDAAAARAARGHARLRYENVSTPDPAVAMYASCSEVDIAIEEKMWYRSAGGGAAALVAKTTGVCALINTSSIERRRFTAFVDVLDGTVVHFVDGERSNKVNKRSLLAATPKQSTHRALRYYADYSVSVKDYNSGSILFDDSYTTLPTSPVNIAKAANNAVYFFNLMKAVSNGAWSTSNLEIRLRSGSTSVFYSISAYLVVGTGYENADSIGAAYTDHLIQMSSDLDYYGEPGAIKEAYKYIYGETLDILSDSTTGLKKQISRDKSMLCTTTAYSNKVRTSAQDASSKWIIGDDVPTFASTDMYFPECFGIAGSMRSPYVSCGIVSGGASDVTKNSGIVSRLYAILVDGYTTMNGIGIVKAFNLFFRTELTLDEHSDFDDFADLLYSACLVNIGLDLYELDYTGGTSTVSSLVLTAADCATVSAAIETVHLSDDICSGECSVFFPAYVGNGACDNYGEYKKEKCGYDMGDCCAHTCVSREYTCGSSGYSCQQPSSTPTLTPTITPTNKPSLPPTIAPTKQPTMPPTPSPTKAPTAPPSIPPSVEPTASPSGAPSGTPSGVPSSAPSGDPSASPTGRPSGEPSSVPSAAPSADPTASPSGAPSGTPSGVPSSAPSGDPSASPTGRPSGEPSSVPSAAPSADPTASPSGAPSGTPSGVPSSAPSGDPSASPTGRPSGEPSSVPSAAPSVFIKPSIVPTTLALNYFESRYSDDGQNLLLTFAEETDRAQELLGSAVSAFSCSKLLSFASASSSSCVWSSSRVLVASLVQSTEVPVVGDYVFLLAGVVKPLVCNNGFTCNYYVASSVPLLGPLQPVVPSLNIDTAAIISSCTDIIVDLSKSTGRGSCKSWASLRWSVSGTDAQSAYSIETYLSKYASSATGVVRVSRGIFSVGLYNIRATATNLFNKSGSTFATVEVSSSTDVPAVVVTGQSTLYRYERLSMTAVVTASLCSGSSIANFAYSWSVSSDDVQLDTLKSVSANSKLFKLDAYTLNTNRNYTVSFTVTTITGFKSTASRRIYVGRSGVSAVLSGGSSVTAGPDGQISLDASGSFDLDYPNEKSILQYEWVCHSRVIGSLSSAPCPIVLGNVPTHNIDVLNLNASLEHEFTVFVTRATDIVTKTYSASQVVRILSFPSPDVSLGTIAEKYSNNIDIVVSSTIVGAQSTFAAWSLIDSALNAVDLPINPTTPVTKTLKPGTKSFAYSLSSAALTPASSYTLQLKASYIALNAAPETAVSFAKATIVINGPPYGGIFLASPLYGSALNTSFAFSATDWLDNIEDFPLVYRFNSYSLEAEDSFLIRDFSTVSETTSVLGPGLAALDYNVTCVLSVADNLGSRVSRELWVEIVPQTDLSLVLQNTLSLLNASTGSDDTIKVLGASARSSMYVNCSGAPSCASLNRLECKSTPSTCGACMSDYQIGEFGDANSVCVDEDTWLFGKFRTEILSKVSQYATPRALQLSTVLMKECPMDCSGRGDCVFKNWFGDVVDSCQSSDSACNAVCLCSPMWFGVDCSTSLHDFNNLVETKNVLCEFLLDNLAVTDITEDALLSYAEIVAELLQDVTDLSDIAVESCTAVLTNIINEDQSLFSTRQTAVAVLKSLSRAIGIGPRLSSAMYSDILESVSTISYYYQQSVWVEHGVLELYTANLRFVSAVVFGSDLVPSTDWKLAQSAIESVLRSNISSLALSVSADDDVSFGVGVWEVLTNTGFNSVDANSSVVYVQFSDIDEIGEGISNVSVSLYNHGAVQYIDNIDPDDSVKYVHCEKNPYGDEFELSLNCGAETDQKTILCPGNESVVYAYECGFIEEGAICAAVGLNCSTISFTPYKTSCECSKSDEISRPGRRLLESRKDITFELKANKQTLYSKPLLLYQISGVDKQPHRNLALMAVCSTIAASMLAVVFFHTSESLRKESLFQREYRSLLCLLEQMLPYGSAHGTLYSRFVEQLKENSEFLFFWSSCSHRPSETEPSRGFKNLVVLVCSMMNTICVHSLLALYSYGSTMNCEAYYLKAECNHDGSNFLFDSVCEWNGSSCHPRMPTSDIRPALLLVIVTAICITPLNYFCRCCVDSMILWHHSRNTKKVYVDAMDKPMDKYESSTHSVESNTAISVDDLRSVYKNADMIMESALKNEHIPALHVLANVSRKVSGSSTVAIKGKLVGSLMVSTQTAVDVSNGLNSFSQLELKNIFLVQRFVLFCLSHHVMEGATAYICDKRPRWVTTMRRSWQFVFACLLPMWVGLTTACAVFFSNQVSSSDAEVSWLILVSISILFSVVISHPIRILTIHLLIPDAFGRAIVRMHNQLKSQYKHITDRMRIGKYSRGVEVVNMFNPVCQAVKRNLPYIWTTDMMKSLLWVHDTDIYGSRLESVAYRLLDRVVFAANAFMRGSVLSIMLEFFVTIFSALLLIGVYAATFLSFNYFIAVLVFIISSILLVGWVQSLETSDVDENYSASTEKDRAQILRTMRSHPDNAVTEEELTSLRCDLLDMDSKSPSSVEVGESKVVESYYEDKRAKIRPIKTKLRTIDRYRDAQSPTAINTKLNSVRTFDLKADDAPYTSESGSISTKLRAGTVSFSDNPNSLFEEDAAPRSCSVSFVKETHEDAALTKKLLSGRSTAFEEEKEVEDGPYIPRLPLVRVSGSPSDLLERRWSTDSDSKTFVKSFSVSSSPSGSPRFDQLSIATKSRSDSGESMASIPEESSDIEMEAEPKSERRTCFAEEDSKTEPPPKKASKIHIPRRDYVQMTKVVGDFIRKGPRGFKVTEDVIVNYLVSELRLGAGDDSDTAQLLSQRRIIAKMVKRMIAVDKIIETNAPPLIAQSVKLAAKSKLKSVESKRVSFDF